MPGKRKQTAPRKADEQKRQCLAWNMQDMFVNNLNTTDAGQTVAGQSSSHEPSQVTTEHRQTNSQSDGFLESLNTTDQSNALHADLSHGREPPQVNIEHEQVSSQSDGILEYVSTIDQSNGLHADQSLGSEVLDVAHGAKSVHFDEFSVVEIDIASSPPDVDSFVDGITDSSVGSATNGTVFADPVDGYNFFLTLFDSVDDAKWHCSLGTIVLNLFSIDGSGNLPKVLPTKASPVLYIFEHTEKHVLHLESLPDLEEIEGHTNDIADLEEDDQDIYVFATTAVGVSMLSGLAHMYKKKAARLVLRRYDPFQGTLELQLYLLEEALSRPQFASEGLTGKGVSRKLNRTLQELMEYFLGIPIPESYHVVHKKRQDVEGLYRHVREAHQGEDRSLTLDPQHHLLVPSLRPYQKEAVLWMLEMEQYGTDLQRESRAQADELHLLWREVQMPDGQTLFFNRYTGSLCKEKQSGLVPIPGGILADEMGLGKTVEALALMLLHPRPGFNRTTSAAGCMLQDKNRTTVGMLQNKNKTADAIAGTIQDENRTTSAAECTLQDKNRTTVGMSQDENKTTNATTSCTLQDENRTADATAGTIQDENRTADAIAGTIQDENRTTSAAGCMLQDKNRTTAGMLQDENKITGAKASTLQDENRIADATAGTIQDESRTADATAGTIQDENRTADATAGTLQDENRTADATPGTLQDENRKADAIAGTLQDENRTADATAGTIQDESRTADATAGTIQDENRTADATAGTIQDENKIADATAGTLQDENGTADATARTLQDKNRIAAACTTQGENKTSSATAITFQEKNRMSPDIKKSEVQCNGKDDVTVTFSKDTNCCKTHVHVESSKMDITAGKSNAHPELNRSSTENSNNVLLKLKEEEASVMEVANLVSEKTDSENTAAGIQQTSTHNSSNGPAILQPNGPDGKESVCKMTDLTESGSDRSDSTLVSEGTSVQGSVEGKGKAKEVCHMHAATVSGTVSSACVVSMDCPEEITCTTQETVDSCTTALHAQEQRTKASQEVQAQQPSTSSTDAQRQKRQKKSSKKTASKEKSKKSKKGATLVEPVYIPAPESCNVQSTNRFECICGVTDAHVDGRTRLQCWRCGNWQHAVCVNYDATSEPTKMAEPYHCPHCSVSLPAVPSGATLIISPAPISHQWVDEINRHVRKSAINMLVYSGVKKQGFLQPKVLADHDIVITTYDVLRLELNYVDISHSNSAEGRRFRHQKRYMAVPSPLPSVEWWRVCLDEAQMVECTTAKAAEMALRLSAVNRWCVTGTPIQRNLEDMYGLLLFLGVDPYWVKHWWERLLYQPYCHGNPRPMYDVIAKVMWRTAKKDVLDQINLPQQTEEVHWLKFSPVEEHFYRRKHEDCSRHAFKVLSQWHDLDTKLCQLDRRTMQTMLWPLLKLRQACCHPQAVRGEFLPLHKSTMTMDELLKSLTQKCKIECEEAHRQLICALNGLAGIHIIKEEYPEAVEKYREVLRSVQEHEGRLKTDKLQRLHTLHNLAGMLQRKLPGVAPTLRDDQLLKQAEELKMYYMQKSLDKIHTSQQTLLPIQQKVQQLRRKLQPGTPWWMDALQSAIYWGKDEDLAERIRNELSGDRDPDATSIVNKFRDLRGLQFLLTSQLENLQQSHTAVCTAVNHLSQEPTQQIIQSAVECHLRPEKGEELHTCEFCKADDLFLEYESRLFSFTAKIALKKVTDAVALRACEAGLVCYTDQAVHELYCTASLL
ncbi:SHPRH [Branchiostoma lanceolatum]|uniref:SHPRH protein n=1 Tax=Branchiostoma lanceolatum TaxID=7740 RepID=A0A8J9YQG5_BRALA|nr:SHPRH [Branchiostoma lanceolatum]